MKLHRIEPPPPIGIIPKSRAAQESDPLDENSDEGGIAGFESGLEVGEGEGVGEEAAVGEAAELADGLVGDGGERGSEAEGDGVAGVVGVEVEGGRGG